jgi:hypothetical protein
VAELGRVLTQGLGKGRVVFCMTQCHAGGFHYLAVPHEMTPNLKWFTKAPEWATPKEQAVFPRVAGFAATDEFSAAAGCDPSPDPDKWAGYERFVPEKLLGMDLFTFKPTGRALRSFAEAHVAATLVDSTIDKPYSTSEQYLERWATLIENRLIGASNLTARVESRLAAYKRAVDGAGMKGTERLFRDRQALFGRFNARVAEENPAVRELVLNGTRKQLEDAIGPTRGRGRGRGGPPPGPAQTSPGENQPPRRRGGSGQQQVAEAKRLWKESIRPAWQSVVEQNEVAVVPAAALEFEKHLLRQETQGREYLFDDADMMEEEIFWQSGFSNPQTMNLPKAESVARWGAERRERIMAWARNAPDQQVRAAAQKLMQTMARRWGNGSAGQASDVPGQPIAKKVAAQRVLFGRRVLAAWDFLLAMNERPALAHVRELTELERTPLPSPAHKPAAGSRR